MEEIHNFLIQEGILAEYSIDGALQPISISRSDLVEAFLKYGILVKENKTHLIVSEHDKLIKAFDKGFEETQESDNFRGIKNLAHHAMNIKLNSAALAQLCELKAKEGVVKVPNRFIGNILQLQRLLDYCLVSVINIPIKEGTRRIKGFDFDSNHDL